MMQSFATKFLFQTGALSFKSMLTLWRSRRFTTLYCIIPLLTVVAIGTISNMLTAQVIPPLGGVTMNLSRCRVFNVYGRVISGADDQRCSTVAYAPNTIETEDIMRRLADTHGFSRGHGNIGSFDVVSFESAEVLSRELLRNPGRVDAGIVFTNISTTGASALRSSLPSFEYELWYNKTALRVYGRLKLDPVGAYYKVSGRNLALQQAVDAAIIAHATASTSLISADYRLTLDTFPQQNDISFLSLIGATNVESWLGPPILAIGLTAQCLMVLALLIGEKESGMLFTLRRMGMVEATYWSSWFCVLMILNLVSSLLVALFAGPLTGINLFALTDRAVLLVVWWSSSCGHTAMAIALAAIIPAKHIEVACALVTLLIVGFTLYYSSLDTYEPQTGNWQSERSPDFLPLGSALFFTFPFYHFGRILDLVLQRTKTAGDEGVDRYNWSNLKSRGGLEISASKDGRIALASYRPEGAAFSLAMLLLLCVFYLCVAWYFGQLFAGHEGITRPFWFPCLPEYWGFHRRGKVIYEGDVPEKEKWLSKEESSIRAHKLSVSYGKVQALRESTFVFESGQIIALLGVNGAGKSSLINVLTGLVPPTFGHAYINGMDVTSDVGSLQKVMGTCPQHDTLFTALSGREHLMVFCTFKGLWGKASQDEIALRLGDVELTRSADFPVGTYSGGMKRRLSVAMSSIANPSIIFYDEPTTGMDPIVRRKIWSAIQRLKKGRSVILTTHAMEEADALGDRIAVLHEGRIRAYGTATELKRRFGTGYHMSMSMTDATQELQVRGTATKTLPGAVVVGSADSLRVTIPKETLRHLPHFFSSLNECGVVGLEWGMRNSTLEEVFLGIVGEQRGLAKGSDEDGATAYVEIDSSMAIFALEQWGGAITDGELQERSNWLRKALNYLRSDKGAALTPATWRPKTTPIAYDAEGSDDNVDYDDTDSGKEDDIDDESARPFMAELIECTDEGTNASPHSSVARPPDRLLGRLAKYHASPRWARTIFDSDSEDSRRSSNSSRSGSCETRSCSQECIASNGTESSNLCFESPQQPHPAIMVVPSNELAFTSLSAVPKIPSTLLQVKGIVLKSLALQRKKQCFNACSCCFVFFAVILTWLYGLANPVEVISTAPQNCTQQMASSVVVAVPNNLCSEHSMVDWMSGHCPIVTVSSAAASFQQFEPPHVLSWEGIQRERDKDPEDLPMKDDFPSTWAQKHDVAADQETSPRSIFFAESRGDYETSTDFGIGGNYGTLFNRVFRDGWLEGVLSSDVYYDLWPVGGPVGIAVCCPEDSLMFVSRQRKEGAACAFFNRTNFIAEDTLTNMWINGRLGDYLLEGAGNWSDYFDWVEEKVDAVSRAGRAMRVTTRDLRFLVNKPFEQAMTWVPAVAEISPRYPLLLDRSDPDYKLRNPKLIMFQSTEVLEVRTRRIGLQATSQKRIKYQEDELQTSTRPTSTSVWFVEAPSAKDNSGVVSLLRYSGIPNSSVTEMTVGTSVRDSVRVSQAKMAARMVTSSPWGTRGAKGWNNNGGYNVLTCNGLAGFSWSPNDRAWPDTRAVVVSERDDKDNKQNTEGPFMFWNATGEIGDAGAVFADNFPEYGLELHRSDPSVLTLHATLLFYGFGWSSAAWPYARVFAEVRCENGVTDRCCDAHQVAGPNDWGGEKGLYDPCKRLVSGDDVKSPANRVPNSGLFDAAEAAHARGRGVSGESLGPAGGGGTLRESVLDLRLPSMLSWTSNALLKAAVGALHATNGAATQYHSDDNPIRTTYVAFPVVCSFPDTPTGTLGWQLFVVPLAVSFLLPPFAAMLVEEKTQLLFHGMKIKGASSTNYWAGSYCYGFLAFAFVGLSYCALAYSLGITSFLNCSWALLAGLMLSWAHAQAMLGFFLAGCFNDGKGASIVAHLCLFVTTVVSGVINDPNQGQGGGLLLEPYPAALLVFPPFAFARALSLCLLYGGDLDDGFWAAAAAGNDDLAESLLWLVLSSSVLGCAGVFLHARYNNTTSTCVSGSASSIAAWFLDFLSLSYGLCEKSAWWIRPPSSESPAPLPSRSRIGSTNADLQKTVLGGTTPTSTEKQWFPDEMVTLEDEAVLSGNAARDPRVAVLLENFTRIFPARTTLWRRSGVGDGEKVAVDGVNLAIRFGECFGLLGPNGAGKTTLLETLSGLAVPQRGRALINGIDITEGRSTCGPKSRAMSLIGVCPQFDIVWADLTVREHLLLSARLRGIGSSNRRSLSSLCCDRTNHELIAAVSLAASKVGLDGDPFELPSKQLSGGMRRRLSIAAALIGEPKIIIMDEPTTGCDPETRLQIYDIIEKERRHDRAIILTTHSMEEADTLCTRIGIMAAGRLRALGTAQRLKATYGKGSKLQVTLDHQSHPPPDTLVWSCFRGQTPSNQQNFIEVDEDDNDGDECKGEAVTHDFNQGKGLLVPETRDAEDALPQLGKIREKNDCCAMKRVEDLAKGRNTTTTTGGSVVVTYSLPHGCFDTATLLAALQNPALRAHHAVCDWSLSQPSLEEVFVDIAEKFTRD